MSRELDREVATLLGWTVQPWIDSNSGKTFYKIVDPNGKEQRVYNSVIIYDTELRAWKNVPQFSTNIDAAWQVESEIERRGLAVVYVAALCRVLNLATYGFGPMFESGEWDTDDMWRFLRATPEERCRAALAAATEETP